MRYYCTYFDHRYLPRGLALLASLRHYSAPFRLWVLCMDQACYEALVEMHLPDVELVALEELEQGDALLLQAKQNRSLVEYYFTCTPSLPLFILGHWPDVDLVTYLDADLFLFADPAPILAEMGDHSIAIVGHRFPPALRWRERFGLYNVSWLSFRRDEQALACLRWWRERCLEWCYDRVEEGRFADQKYLDDWPRLFGAVVLQHKGANLAPWNLANYRVHWQGGQVRVDEQELIFYHFHGVKPLKSWLYNLQMTQYEVMPSPVVLRRVYQPYIRMLLQVSHAAIPRMRRSLTLAGLIRHSSAPIPTASWPVRALGQVRDLLRIGKGLLVRSYVIVIGEHIV